MQKFKNKSPRRAQDRYSCRFNDTAVYTSLPFHATPGTIIKSFRQTAKSAFEQIATIIYWIHCLVWFSNEQNLFSDTVPRHKKNRNDSASEIPRVHTTGRDRWIGHLPNISLLSEFSLQQKKLSLDNQSAIFHPKTSKKSFSTTLQLKRLSIPTHVVLVLHQNLNATFVLLMYLANSSSTSQLCAFHQAQIVRLLLQVH